MKFINWFKGSLEDEKGVASFRRIYNWIIICLVTFLVIYVTVKNIWSTTLVYVLSILLAAGFLNTSVITVDNILRFFNKEPNQPEPVPEKQQADISGTITLDKLKPQ